MNAPLFPFMARAAMVRVLELLEAQGGLPFTRLSSPGRYLVAVDRSPGAPDDPKRFSVWGRGFTQGYCSRFELERWVEGLDGTAIHVAGLTLDHSLRARFNQVPR